MLYTAVSKTIHRHPASKLASADELLSTAPWAILYRKAETRENLCVNDNDIVNDNLRLNVFFAFSVPLSFKSPKKSIECEPLY